MFSPAIIKVVASFGKGLFVVAKGPTARIIAVAAAVGIVTISIAIAAGMYLSIRALGSSQRRNLSLDSRELPKFPF